MADSEPTPLVRGMQRLAAGLESAFEASRSIHHRLAAGEARELAVARALEPHFPSRFRLSSGIVVNADGRESRQQDVLVTDPTVGTPFVAEGNIGVHPIQTVAATIQVRSRLSANTMAEVVANVTSVKTLMADEPRGVARLSLDRLSLGKTTMKPFAGIVAFEAVGGHEAIRRAYLEANANVAPMNRVNVLFVLDQFVTVWSPDGRPLSVTWDPADSSFAQTLLAGRDTILFFYVLLIGALNGYSPPPFDLAAYLNRQVPSAQVFSDKLQT